MPDAIAWEFWNVRGERAEVDHSAWQAFLDDYLVQGTDGINRVRYRAVDPAARSRLTGYIQAMAGTDPRTLTRAAQMAYWINLYNALTVNVVLDYPRKRSILRMGRKLLTFGPWDDVVATIAGQQVTLNDIEHRILRPLFRDPRVHFAVNCASVGCPNLAAHVYTAANLEAQLDAQEAAYLAHPRGLRQTDSGWVLSGIFEWYRVDFAADEAGLRAWLAARRPQLAGQLRDSRRPLSYDYDWQLNGAD
ncbi:MAG: DUF547 domain-containing protein [Pseudomonadales bacterium]|nr:DUF547 domain-containing protein [Pseudomonadales bacterium]